MLRASSETAVATFTEANLERPMRTASLQASRRAVAMSFSCSMESFFGVIGTLAAAPAAVLAGPPGPGERALAQEAMSCELLLRANRRTELSSSCMMVARSLGVSCWTGVVARPPRRLKMLRWVIDEIVPERIDQISFSTVFIAAARASRERDPG